MLLTAAALATSRLRLGTLVTPVARRRPEQLARQVATLDTLSDGRVIFGAGLGGPIEDEFASFGDTTDPVVLAERLDEGLSLLSRYWSGETVDHDGTHYRVRDTALLPRDRATTPAARVDRRVLADVVDRCAGRRGGTARCRCSSRRATVRHRRPDEVRELAAYLVDAARRRAHEPFDLVVGGASDPATAADLIASAPGRRRDLVGRARGTDQPRPLSRRTGAAPSRGRATRLD